MPRSVAVNVGANTALPGFRGPIYPDGRFDYVPIPEREPTREAVPTYADIGPALSFDIPADVAETPLHLDPEFAGYLGRDRYTYGDEHGVKARPLSTLEAGDYLLFYATLDLRGNPDDATDEVVPGWGAYLIGEFRVERVVSGDACASLSAADRSRFETNAHLRRESFDASVLVGGGPESRLYERAVPLSGPEGGTAPNRLVTRLSTDSGRGPWWRRPLRFDEAATAELRAVIDERTVGRVD